MLNKTKAGLIRRKKRIRKKISGSAEVPRLTVHRSLKHFYAQIIDDGPGKTLIAVSTLDKEHGEKGRNKTSAGALGKRLAEKAKAVGVERVVFDRNGYLYHGCMKALADAAREAGLKF